MERKKKIGKVQLIKLHRIISWLMAFFALATIFTGYLQTAHLIENYILASKLHRLFEWFFIILLILHIGFSSKLSKISWKRSINWIKNGTNVSIHLVRVLQRVTSWFIVLFGLIIILSGFNGFKWFNQLFGEYVPFYLHRDFDILLTIFMISHIILGFRFFLMRKQISVRKTQYAIIVMTLLLIVPVILVENYKYQLANPIDNSNGSGSGHIIYIGENSYSYSALSTLNINSLRPDLFKDNFFSLFDVLVFVAEENQIPIEYHFDSSLNTYVIESLDNHDDWWYEAYYSGGWPENNVFRMDHYPWKEETTIHLFHEDIENIESYYEVFRKEIERKNLNANLTIIPQVRIRGNGLDLTFTNVSVEPFNLRNDTFQENTLTAIDIMLSLNNSGLISLDLKWYSSIGTADIVNNYWIHIINNKSAHGTCGWVYEAGSDKYEGFKGNHIHIPSDYRIINSPEYALWFWICL